MLVFILQKLENYLQYFVYNFKMEILPNIYSFKPAIAMWHLNEQISSVKFSQPW